MRMQPVHHPCSLTHLIAITPPYASTKRAKAGNTDTSLTLAFHTPGISIGLPEYWHSLHHCYISSQTRLFQNIANAS